jgi:hypothetical protein
MTEHPLLTDDLVLLLQQFPNPALLNIVSILKEHKSWSPLPASRAYEAHEATSNDQLLPHVPAIAQEILWWGSNDVHRQFGELRDWCERPSRSASGDIPRMNLTRAVLGIVQSYRHDFCPSYKIPYATEQGIIEVLNREFSAKNREFSRQNGEFELGSIF